MRKMTTIVWNEINLRKQEKIMHPARVATPPHPDGRATPPHLERGATPPHLD